MSAQIHIGKIFLIGAGPGDPGLLTVRGADLLALAEVVVYDHLANPLLLSYCPQAEKIFVGKKAADHTLTQDQINQLLVEKAKAGKIVARLKGGDPFVFGRGGEECLAALQAGIEFEIVPGITASIAAPAYAGIPVTHRDFNSSFTLVTGHEKEEEYRDDQAKQRPPAAGSSDIDWAVLAKLPCLAFYMGVKALPRICKNLMDNGMSPATPAASIQWGTRPQQRTVAGTLADLPAKVVAAGLGPPALTIIGKVVELRDSLKWFENRPLLGQTVAVTRTRDQSSDLAKKLRAQGAEVIETPTIETCAVDDPAPIDRALKSAGTYDWVIITSINGVSFTRKRLVELGLDGRTFGAARIAAVGQSTAKAIAEQLFLRVDLCPKKFVADAVADELAAQNAIAGKRFLLLRADIARPLLVDRLREAGAAAVDDIPLYHTKLVEALNDDFLWALHDGKITWITFTSSSTAENLCKLLGDDYREQLQKVKLASIGPITSQTLAKLGLPVAVEAEEHTVDGLVKAMCAAKAI